MSFVVQNVDRVAKKSDYAALREDELLVHNTFLTLQGEGPYAGKPAWFLRLAGCNYGNKTKHCSWCDTDFRIGNGHVTPVLDLLKQAVQELAPYPNKLVVVTGGEPLLQSKGLDSLFEIGKEYAPTLMFQVETNGVFHRHIPNLLVAGRSSFVISPKAHSDQGYSEVLMRDLAKLCLTHPHSTYLKFVLSGDKANVHHTVPDQILSETNLLDRVYVSPMAVYKKPYQGEIASAWDPELIDVPQTSANYAYAAEYALRYGLTLSIQQHLFCNLA